MSSIGLSRRIYSWLSIGLALCALWGQGNALPAQMTQAQNRPVANTPDSLGPRHSSSPNQTRTPGDQTGSRKTDMAKLSLLDQTRRHAAEFMNDLPNFVATQIVTRYERKTGKSDWKKKDKAELELSYSSETGEHYKVVRYNDKLAKLTYEKYVSKGANSPGDFGPILDDLFAAQSQAEFKEVRREIFHNRQCVLYDFRIKKAFSNRRIIDLTSGRTITVGYSGSVWIDVESGCALRIEQSADDIEQGFPTTVYEEAVEYDWLDIDGKKRLLPVYSEMIINNEPDDIYARNVMQMTNYHMFGTDVKIILEK